MTTYRGTETVEPGFYFNLRQLLFDSVDQARPLSGDTADVYRRVPVVVLFLVAPLLGLGFVLFLPLIGFGVVAWLIGAKAVQMTADAARAVARIARPSWEPTLAFLSRSKRTETKPEESDVWADDVKKRLDEHDGEAS
jgi:hypothetical protein